MSKTRPFLIAGGASRNATPENPATANDVFRKSRRVACIRISSAELGQIEFRVPDFRGLQQLVPANGTSGIRRRASHHAGQRRLGAFVGLVVELAAVDALDERLFLF